MKPYQIRSSFHALLAGIALLEIKHARTPFRKAVCAAWGAFHVSLAVDDFMDRNESVSNRE